MQAVEASWFGEGDGGESERLAEQSMAAMVGRVLGAKPFPEAARELDQLTRSEAHIDKVVRVLESDPALSARLLRLVNSAGYALRIRCTSVRHAAALVGTARLRQVATTAAILDMFAAGSQRAREITRHAATVGSLCRYLAVHFGLPRDELATCGFLHDIGKLMLLETEGAAYSELLSATDSADQVHELERARYGFDHGMLGSHVLASWNIPEPVPQVVAWHHSPARAMKKGGPIASMVQVLRLADQLSQALQEDRSGACACDIAASEAAQYLDISEPQLAAMWPELVAIHDESCSGGADASQNIAPRTSVSPSLRSKPKPSKTPKQFPCGVCEKPSFGSTCSACGHYVCPEHQVGPDAWCANCAAEFSQSEEEASISGETRNLLIVAGLVLAAVAAISAWVSGASTAAIIVSPVLVWAVLGVGSVVGLVAWKRMSFLRSRRQLPESSLKDLDPMPSESIPDDAWTESVRSIAPPAESDSTTLNDFETRDTHVHEPPTEVAEPPSEAAESVLSRNSTRAFALGDVFPQSAITELDAVGDGESFPEPTEPTEPTERKSEAAALGRRPSQSPDTKESPRISRGARGYNDPAPALSSCMAPFPWKACSMFSDARSPEDAVRSQPTLPAPPSKPAAKETPSFASVAAFEQWAESMPPSDIVVTEEERAAGWI